MTAEPVRPQRSRPPFARRLSPGYLFLAPALLVLGVTSLYPVVYSVALSLFDWNWGTRMNFVGLRNYSDLIGGGEFWQVLGQTFYFSIGAVAIELSLGLALAVVVNQLGFGAGLIRTLLLTPLMVSGIVVSLMWKVMLDPMLGIVNFLLREVGLPTSAFFGTQATAMPTIIGVDAWWQTAFVFIIVLAGLQSLPAEPMEAAKVDGANAWQTFRHVTLPMLRPVLFTVLIFRTIDTLKVFDIIFGTTGGGPQLATEVMQTLAYRKAFSFLQMSEAMTVMVVFSIVIVLLSVLYLRLERQIDGATSLEAD
ncbi:MAG: sugar ABC transporter permease [Trueperaceae bacterium]|nr:MAG: sugar ABC transporter permease [Trueperaceae bacterium]